MAKKINALTQLIQLPKSLMVLVSLLVIPTILFSAELADSDKKRIVYQMFSEYSKEFPSVKVLEVKQAMRLAESRERVVVDVREAEEIDVSIIPGAITQKSFLGLPDKFKNKTIVAYCTIGYRSGIFAREMKKSGIAVYNLKGGILAWTLEGGNVYDSNGIARRIHVYGEKWAYPPKGYEAVVFGFFEKMFK
jgi:rhodanese-related sulfurtransferase